jgi:hypothetical protein
MSDRTRLALGVIVAAFIMGGLGDLLLRQTPWGLNILLWLAALMVATTLLFRLQPVPAPQFGRWMLLPVVIFGAAFAWRDSPFLKLMDAAAILVSLAVASPLPGKARIHLASLVDYVLAGLVTCSYAAVGPLLLVFGDLQWREVSREGWGRPALAVGRGIALATPPLLLFGMLLMSADSVFNTLVRETLHINVERLFVHAFVIASCAWIVAGYLRGHLIGGEFPQEVRGLLKPLSLGIVEIGIVLGFLDALFLAFVSVQLRYLFGGTPLVGITPGLTYAEYARRGFFELVAVAALVLPLLLAAHWLLQKDKPRHEFIFRALAGVQILLLFVIMASAVERMRLYTDQFGLTEQRFYAAAFMGWLAAVFVWFAVTVLRGRRERFAFGAMLAGFLLIVVLHTINPDAVIVRTNIEQAKYGHSFDVRYVRWLSSDAVPVLISHLPELNPQDRNAVATGILKRWPPAENMDWRTWSWSRARAWSVVRNHAVMLKSLAALEKDAPLVTGSP